jgi:hypothetical protein
MVRCPDTKLLIVTGFHKAHQLFLNLRGRVERVNYHISHFCLSEHASGGQLGKFSLYDFLIATSIPGDIFHRIDSMGILVEEEQKVPLDERIHVFFDELEELWIHIIIYAAGQTGFDHTFSSDLWMPVIL